METKTIITENFVIDYQEILRDFVWDSMSIFDLKKSLIKDIFGEIPEAKIKASFFVDRKNFVDYIKSISGGQEPPKWATGCFYNGEIQTLIDLNNARDMEFKKHTLTHEFVHLCFNLFVYGKFNIDRIRWFDESYANFIDGSNNEASILYLKRIAKLLKSVKDLDLNVMNDISKVKTSDYNGYDMFLIVGKYIFDNDFEKQYLETLKSAPEQIIHLGKNILNLAINYIDSLS